MIVCSDNPEDPLGKQEPCGNAVTIYPDAEEYIQRCLRQASIEVQIADIRNKPAKHPLMSSQELSIGIQVGFINSRHGEQVTVFVE